MGVVYGDIGTSPLYAIRECLHGAHAVPPTRENILGVLSLVFWTLVVVVTIKYHIYVIKFDNRGEGGILALMAQIKKKGLHRWLYAGLGALGLFGAALLYGDGILTPAISVLSAIEGLEVATPVFRPYVVPITIAILVLLFVFQRRGTGGIGAVFGPIILVWFATLAVLGVSGILREPSVLAAIAPTHAVAFFAHNGLQGFLVLGAVFLVATGGEALYADLGHFGQRPLQLDWFFFVGPALALNYFGQGALLMGNPQAADNPFYRLAPDWLLYPLVALATMATVIASQAVISGAFSLTRQAVQLGYLPRVKIDHTSSVEIGQIYVPGINWALMFATIALVLAFRQSTHLAAAYGIAVAITMLITTILAYVVARQRRWNLLLAAATTAVFLAVSLAFFGANLIKVAQGGWVPLAIAAAVFLVMATWKRGRAYLAEQRKSALSIEAFLDDLARREVVRVPGSAVFLTSTTEGAPPLLLHHFKHNKVLHEQVILLTVLTESQPKVPVAERVSVEDLGQGFHRAVAHYGFMETPNVPRVLLRCQAAGLRLVAEPVTYYLARETLLTSGRSGLPRWRKRLFSFLSRNARPANAFFGLPPNRVVEMGAQIEI
jgi:KUP system potassium uptake protein